MPGSSAYNRLATQGHQAEHPSTLRPPSARHIANHSHHHHQLPCSSSSAAVSLPHRFLPVTAHASRAAVRSVFWKPSHLRTPDHFRLAHCKLYFFPPLRLDNILLTALCLLSFFTYSTSLHFHPPPLDLDWFGGRSYRHRVLSWISGPSVNCDCASATRRSFPRPTSLASVTSWPCYHTFGPDITFSKQQTWHKRSPPGHNTPLQRIQTMGHTMDTRSIHHKDLQLGMNAVNTLHLSLVRASTLLPIQEHKLRTLLLANGQANSIVLTLRLIIIQ